MATGDKPTVGCRVPDDVAESIEEYQESKGYDRQSEAMRDVLQAGLRELHGPVDDHWRELAFNAGYHLVLLAVVMIVVGFGTSMLGPMRAVALAMVISTIGMAPVAAIEMWRLAAGQATLEGDR